MWQRTFHWRVPLPVEAVLYIKGYTVGIATVLTLLGRLNGAAVLVPAGESFHSPQLCLLSAPSALSCGKAAAVPPGQVVTLARFCCGLVLLSPSSSSSPPPSATFMLLDSQAGTVEQVQAAQPSLGLVHVGVIGLQTKLSGCVIAASRHLI